MRVPENNHVDIFHLNKAFQEKIEYEMIDEEETDQLEQETEPHGKKNSFQKQDSKMSIASGEYEEIHLSEGEFDNEYKSLADTPPPLPPRKSNSTSSK